MKNLTRNELLQRYEKEEIITYITTLKSWNFHWQYTVLHKTRK